MKENDFTEGPIKDDNLGRWICDLRLPDGRRIKKRFRQKRRAEIWWAQLQAKIADGTWSRVEPPRRMTFGQGVDLYLAAMRGRHRSFKSTHCVLKFWERTL